MMAEMRAFKDGNKMIVEGYAIVYNRVADLWGDLEVILPGASTEALAAGDQYYLWQHDPRSPLARKKIGTLEAREDESGVLIRAQFIDNQLGRDSFAAIETKLVDKQSFAFRVKDATWIQETIDGKQIWKRVISKFESIPEFSAVTFPAYEDTDLQARCRELATRDKPRPGTTGTAGATAPEVLKMASAGIAGLRKSITEGDSP